MPTSILESIKGFRKTQHGRVVWNCGEPGVKFSVQASISEAIHHPVEEIFHDPQVELVKHIWLTKAIDVAQRIVTDQIRSQLQMHLFEFIKSILLQVLLIA
jgi:hypothetical protein